MRITHALITLLIGIGTFSNCLLAGFSWNGYIVKTPSSGIVAYGSSINMEIVDFFSIVDLPDNEYPVSDGTPSYEWYVDDDEYPCKAGESVTFTTGANADLGAGDFLITVMGQRTYVIGWDTDDGGDDPPPITTAGFNRDSHTSNTANIETGLVLLAQTDATAAKISIKYNGNNATGMTQSVKAGSKIPLSAELEESSRTVTGYSWSVPGVIFKGYNQNAKSNPLTSITSSDMTQSTISFYWADGGSGRDVSCKLMIGSQEFSGKTTFDVLRPEIPVSVAVDSGHRIIQNNGVQYLIYGGIDQPFGIIFTRTTQIASPYENDEFSWAQIINLGVTSEIPNGVYIIIENALDGSFPYSNTPECGDHPGYPLHTGFTQASQAVNASMYLMYKPQGSDVIEPAWVPLKKVDWFCRGVAKYVNNTWVVDSSEYSPNPVAVNTTAHPNWTTIK